MDKLNITNNDLIDALREALRRDAQKGYEGMTRAEIAKAMKISKAKVGTMLTELHESGDLEVQHVYREAIDGISRPVPIYRLKQTPHSAAE
jgi:DNA-binding transcriptional regulator LsrR (DeoR family)